MPVSDEIDEVGWGMKGPVFSSRGFQSDDGPPATLRYRIYVFRAPYARVARKARAELLSRGAVLRGGVRGTRLEVGNDMTVYVFPGKYDPNTGLTDEDAPWVRVDLIESKPASAAFRWIRSKLS